MLEEIFRQPRAIESHVPVDRVVFLAEEGLSGGAIALSIDIRRFRVVRLRRRFPEGGVVRRSDQAKADRGRNVAEDGVRSVVAIGGGVPPPGHSRRSTRELAKAKHLGRTFVHIIPRASDLRLHLECTVKISCDPRICQKAKLAVGPHLGLPKSAVIDSLDEKSQAEGLNQTPSALLLRSESEEPLTPGCSRIGVVGFYAALEFAMRPVATENWDRKIGENFLAIRQEFELAFGNGELHPFLEEVFARRTPNVRACLAKDRQGLSHLTPASDSCLTQVEGFLSTRSRGSIRPESVRSTAALPSYINAPLAKWTTNPTPLVWKDSRRRMVQGTAAWLRGPNSQRTEVSSILEILGRRNCVLSTKSLWATCSRTAIRAAGGSGVRPCCGRRRLGRPKEAPTKQRHKNRHLAPVLPRCFTLSRPHLHQKFSLGPRRIKTSGILISYPFLDRRCKKKLEEGWLW